MTSKSVPSAGMRGGLGRTLLTAFLVLSIVPLSIISFVAATQARNNLQRELREKLITVAVLTDSQIRNWVADQQKILTILSTGLMLESSEDTSIFFNIDAASSPLTADPSQPLTAPQVLRKITRSHGDDSAFLVWFLFDRDGRVLAAEPSMTAPITPRDLLEQPPVWLEVEDAVIQPLSTAQNRPFSSALLLSQSLPESDLHLAALIDPQRLTQLVDTFLSRSEDLEIYLVPSSGRPFRLSSDSPDMDAFGPSSQSDEDDERFSIAIAAALAGESGAANYENHQGAAVIGAYRWLPELNVALVVEQAQKTAFAASDDLAVVLIGATLAAVLVTAVIAAGVTRRITLPIAQLTATAVQIAAGDLNQKVPASRRDEIGILARAFNVMTTKLRLLYEDLEQKVKERTQQLQDANAEVRYQAMLLAISAEVGRVVTSILDRDRLLSRVVELIRDCFQTYFVAIYFIDENGESAVLQEATGGLGAQLRADGHRVGLNKDHLISQAVNTLAPQTLSGIPLTRQIDRQRFPHTRAELAIPLRIGERIVGVLDVHSVHKDAFEGNEVMVLETLSEQVVVAIENARAYETERRALEQLREVDELRRRFLSNMSRELRMPLNNIIGFSRVILKGIDGPITDLQREDLTAIHDSGQQLLVLINDILDIAQIEAGAMELSTQLVDLGEIAQSIVPTAGALLEGRPIDFRCDIGQDLPLVMADPHRLRQVLVKLLSNAAKFTQQGEIKLSVWRNDDEIVATVADSGIGIPDKDRDVIFEVFRQVAQPVEGNNWGTGLGLTFSKEIVEMHGGTIWLESQEGKGTAFTITLPIAKAESQEIGG